VTLKHGSAENTKDKNEDKSDDQDEEKGQLSEGEIQEPRKRPKSTDPPTEEVPRRDNKDKDPATTGPSKKDRVCILWRQGKCRRGKKCHYLHQIQKRKPTIRDPDHLNSTGPPGSTNTVSKGEERTMAELKSKSLYAVVYSFRRDYVDGSCWRSRWRGRSLFCCRFWCILGIWDC
jgi:hypothetical protein